MGRLLRVPRIFSKNEYLTDVLPKGRKDRMVAFAAFTVLAVKTAIFIYRLPARISNRIRPDEPLGDSTSRMAASVGAISLTVIA